MGTPPIHIDGILINTTTLGQSEPESNGNERVLHTHQNWSLTIRYNLVPYPEHPHFCRVSYPSAGIQSACSKFCEQGEHCLRIILGWILFIYIYICIFRQHFFVNANFIKHNRHFMSTYFLLDPFEFPYYFYCILGELIYVLS